MARSHPAKVAILGGGVAAMATAFELTNVPGWQQRYEITIYQMGWRLGGQCASGRGPHDRIEEHGLHVLLGCYENAFRILRQCYAELDRDHDAPLATWEQAFKPYNGIIFQEHSEGSAKLWPMDFPSNGALPGDGGLFPKPRDYLSAAVGFLRVSLRTLRRMQRRNRRRLFGGLRHAPAIVRALASLRNLESGTLRDNVADLLRRGVDSLWHEHDQAALDDDAVRRTLILIDICATTVAGILRDDLIGRGFDSVDDEDLVEWLARHGAHETSTASAVVRALYTLVFATPSNGLSNSGLAAGAALRTAIRIVCSYKGAVSYKMQAATGDTIFAPLYTVLRERGVRFAFYQRVDRLGLSPDKDQVETIQVTSQARLKNGTYEPLFDVAGLPSWPATPRFEQLVNGARLKKSKVDFEAGDAENHPARTRILRLGSDFDIIVLGIGFGALPDICGELAARNLAWREMFERVRTTATIGIQVWSRQPRKGATPLMLSSEIGPFSGYAEMSQLICRESWTAETRPHHLLHACHRLEENEIPTRSAPARVRFVHRRVRDWLAREGTTVVPGIMQNSHGKVDWQVLVDPMERAGPKRLDAQYWCINDDPSNRYVLSVPGSTRFRLRADESGFSNLFLAGAWTRNGLDIGAVETAAVSGMQAARAISGHPAYIPGESDFRY